MSNLKALLNPQRFSSMSPRMAAIVGCILGEAFTDPYLVELFVTSDGYVLGRRKGDIGANDFIGTFSDQRRNWDDLLNAAKLSQKDRIRAQALFTKAVN